MDGIVAAPRDSVRPMHQPPRRAGGGQPASAVAIAFARKLRSCHTGGVLVRPQLSIAGVRRRRLTKPDLALVADIVAPKILEALRLASDALSAAKVRHVVVGGLAVGANGYPRATKDVDFLVGAEAFHHHASGLVTLRAEIPFQVKGVAIDLLSPEPDEPFLEAALAAPLGSVLEAAPLIYMKLKSPRRKDRVDVIELIKGGIDTKQCREYLAAHAPAFVTTFDECVADAEAEQD
jgi:hypothetical protein